MWTAETIKDNNNNNNNNNNNLVLNIAPLNIKMIKSAGGRSEIV